MTERLNDEFVPSLPEFDEGPQAPHYQSSPERLLGGAAIPFGFSEAYSTPVTDDGFDLGAAEIRSSQKSREDNTTQEYLPF